jgi:hypothetical protein
MKIINFIRVTVCGLILCCVTNVIAEANCPKPVKGYRVAGGQNIWVVDPALTVTELSNAIVSATALNLGVSLTLLTPFDENGIPTGNPLGYSATDSNGQPM